MGNSPVRKEFLPFHRPLLGKEEEDEVIQTMRSGWLTTGTRTFQFERDFAEYRGVKYAVGLNSCTAGLHLALVALGIGRGDEVITTPITWPSTANVVLHQGAVPIFVDVESDTLNIDANKIEEVIRPNTKAIIVVHLAGHPCDMDRITEIAKRHGLYVIEDAAHALEAEYKGRKTGALGDVASFSFYPTKNITTGEGGMLTTNNKEIADKAAMYRLHGISKDAWKRYGSEGYHHWEAIYPGYKYNMPDTASAIGIHQLRRVDGFLERRRELVAMYDTAFCTLPEVNPLGRRDYALHAHHLYIIQVDVDHLAGDRDTIMNAIQAENIGIGIHFRALHLQGYYRNTYYYQRGDYPNAEYASDRVISLPLYPAMSDEDALDVIHAVEKVVKKYRR